MSTTAPHPAPPRPPRSVLGLLREPRWVRGLALAVAVACVCVVLGQWQWHRRQERLARNAPLVQNYDDPPVALAGVLAADGTALAAGEAWTRVRVRGEYVPADTVLVRNRPRDDATGYEVLVPLRTEDGALLLVDRGWLPAGASSSAPDAVPAPPAGPVVVTAHLRPFEAARRGEVPAGQVSSVARAEVVRASGGDALLGGYAELESETPSAADAPAPAVRPAVDEGPHLAYTVQWYGFALTALVVWRVAGRRELENRRGAGPAPSSGAAGALPAPSRRPRRRREGVDEAAEDVEVDGAAAARSRSVRS